MTGHLQNFLPSLFVWACVGFLQHELSAADVDDDSHWRTLSAQLPGVDGRVSAFTTANGKLYAGGQFSVIGGLVTKGVAAWDGTRWSALGSGIAGEVTALLIQGTDLIAGGGSSESGRIPVARWDGAKWSPLDQLSTGVSGGVYALAEFRGAIYAGGSFKTETGAPSYLASWNGSKWLPVAGGVDGTVWALREFDGYLYIGGAFKTAGGAGANGVARWDGVKLESVGQGVRGSLAAVYALSIVTTNLYVGGDFGEVGGESWVTAPGLAKLSHDASKKPQWRSGGTSVVSVRALRGVGDRLIIGGRFNSIGTASSQNVAELTNDGKWISYSTGVSADGASDIGAIESFGSEIFCGGFFQKAGDQQIPGIARWTGSAWLAAGTGKDLSLNELSQRVEVVGSRVYVFGIFTMAGSTRVNGAAEWTGTDWLPMGNGVPQWTQSQMPYTATDGTNLYVTMTGSRASPFVNRWDGGAWSTVGPAGVQGPVAASTTNLFAVGNFSQGYGVAKLEGGTWTQLGGAFNRSTGVVLVHQLKADGTNVYAAGPFDSIGGVPIQNVALWDGTKWQKLGTGFPPGVTGAAAMAFADGKLYVGSNGTIYVWDGSSWTTPLPGLNGARIQSIIPDGNNLWVGGRFSDLNGTAAANIARWDGTQWHPLGSGVPGTDPFVNALAIGSEKLYVGGTFTIAGGKGSRYFAIWHKAASDPIEMKFVQATNHVGIGQKFEVTVDVRNLTSDTLTDVAVLPETLEASGSAGVKFVSATTVFRTLPFRTGEKIIYTFEATGAGRLVFKGYAGGRRADGTAVTTPMVTSQPVLVSPGDLLVQREGETVFDGEEIYQNFPTDPQVKTNSVAANVDSNFSFAIVNRDSVDHTFLLKAFARGNPGWLRTYQFADSDFDWSAELEGANGLETVVEAEETVFLEIVMRATNAPIADVQRIEVTLSPKEDPATILDTIEVVTALANEIVVNSTGDDADADTSDGVPDVDLTKPGLQTTLRCAIDFANKVGGKDIIKFDIPSTDLGWRNGLAWIQPKSPLPAVTQAVRIDAATQANGRVVLNGLSAGITDGLRILAGNCDIRGMIINQFQGAGISVDGGGGAGEIAGNIIGTDPAGTPGLGNVAGIVVANTTGMVIGGSTPEDRNVISGNSGAGISLFDSASAIARANIVGATPDGTRSLPNGTYGLFAEHVTGLLVGVKEALSIFSGPTAMAIRSSTGGSGSGEGTIVNCYIGIDPSGSKPISGDGSSVGIILEDCANFVIGEADKGVRNVLGGISGTAIRLLRGKNIKVGANYIGTDVTGTTAFTAGIGVEAEGVKDCEIGHPGKPSVYNAQDCVRLRAIGHEASDATHVRACNFGLKSDGQSAFTTVKNGLVISESDGVVVGFVSGPLLSAELNHFAGAAVAAITVANSANIRIGANNVGTDITGNADLAAGTGIIADTVRNLFIGAKSWSSIYNAKVGMHLSSITAEKATSQASASGGIGESGIINTRVGLKASGIAAFNTMVSGLILEDSSRFQIGADGSGTGQDSSAVEAARNIFAGIQEQAIQLLRCVDIRIGASHIGTGANGKVGLAVAAGIVADNVRNLAIGSSKAPTVINATTTGMDLRGLGKDLALPDEQPNRIRGCSFGVDASHKLAFDDGFSAPKGLIVTDSEDVQIGADGEGEGNGFGGLSNAVEIKNTRRVRMENAKIGFTTDDGKPIRNSGVGVVIEGTSSEIELGGKGNQIIHCALEGISISANALFVRVRNTLIYDNFKAIKRAVNGAHYPKITRAFWGSTHVEGTVNGNPNETVHLEFYAHRPNRPAEAEVFIGAADLPLDLGGVAAYNSVFPKSAPRGWLVTSTASDGSVGTSELSESVLIRAPADSDGDGLPDFWEAMYPTCLNPAVPDPADEDCDGDGFANTQEYLANTDPTRADSSLRIDHLAVAGASSISFPAVPGRQYALERSPNVADGPWTRIVTVQPDGAGVVTLNDPKPITPRAFYRIVAEFP